MTRVVEPSKTAPGSPVLSVIFNVTLGRVTEVTVIGGVVVEVVVVVVVLAVEVPDDVVGVLVVVLEGGTMRRTATGGSVPATVLLGCVVKES